MDKSHFYNACNCSVGLDSNKLISTRALMNEEIGYRFSVSEPCDWTAFRSCVGQCVIFFPAFSNDFDLSKPPNVPAAEAISLNDRLCSQLENSNGTVDHSFASRAHLYATLKCFVNDASVDLNAAQFVSGSLMFSQQLVNCDTLNWDMPCLLNENKNFTSSRSVVNVSVFLRHPVCLIVSLVARKIEKNTILLTSCQV